MTNADTIAAIAIWATILAVVAFTIAALAREEGDDDSDNVEEA